MSDPPYGYPSGPVMGDPGTGGSDPGSGGGYPDTGSTAPPVPPPPPDIPCAPLRSAGGQASLLTNLQAFPVPAAPPVNCPIVIVPGQRPPAANPDGELLSATPWLPQWACNLWSVFCSGGQRPQPSGDTFPMPENERRTKLTQCLQDAHDHGFRCLQMKQFMSPEELKLCADQVEQEIKECTILWGPDP